MPLVRNLAKGKFEFGCTGTPDAQHLTRAIEELYSSTLSSDRGLRDIAIYTAMVNSQVLWEDSGFNNMVEKNLSGKLKDLNDKYPKEYYTCAGRKQVQQHETER